MCYSYRAAARVLLYASSHRQDNTYHGVCYTSRGALAGTRMIGSKAELYYYYCYYYCYYYYYYYYVVVRCLCRDFVCLSPIYSKHI